MKVTVTFGDTAVVVPCRAGWTVRDLTEQATKRYRKILEQYGEAAVRTHHVEYMDGGILDMDDQVADLVEDRDKLVAVFEEDQRWRMPSPGSSFSNSHSSSSPSPDRSPDPIPESIPESIPEPIPEPIPESFPYYSHAPLHQPIRGEIEVNEASLKANTPLLVRSSSDSALAPPLEITATPPYDDHSNNRSPEPEVSHALKGALDRLRTDHHHTNKMSHITLASLTKRVELSGEKGPLGIHVIPYCSSLSGRTLGLHIKGIEENSRCKRENIFKEDECIVQINDTPLIDKTFAESQDVFRRAMASSLVRLEVLPVPSKPRYEKSLIGQLFTSDGQDPAPKALKSPLVVRAKTDLKPDLKPDLKLDSKADSKLEVKRPDVRAKTPDPPASLNPPAEVQPGQGYTERAPSVSPSPPAAAASPSPDPKAGSQSPLPKKSPGLPGLANLTSKKGGKKIKIDLMKGAEGLGFTVVTRDSSVHGPGPILIKNILPRGAAIKDGRLQPGDRILEVNGVDMTGRSQEELVAMLRSTKQGESVAVVVSRQEEIFLPRELKGEEAGSLVLEDGREQLTYEIPLNDTGSAGLGVSLKGNRSRETGEDLGIFIKSIIHGGAAYKDGRLRVNDQLVAVNGEPLLGRSNHAAMETLRRSMSWEGNARGTIQLVLLRSATQAGTANSGTGAAAYPSYPQAGAAASALRPSSSNQNTQELQEPEAPQPWAPDDPSAYRGSHGPSGPSAYPATEPDMNGASHYIYTNDGAAYPPATTSNGLQAHYPEDEEELEEGLEEFPPPPSPGAVEEMNRDLPLSPPHHSVFDRSPYMADEPPTDRQLARHADNTPRNRASKSMDMMADESDVGSLVGQRTEPAARGALGPTLGLWKSSSLESLQTAVSQARQSQSQTQVPFHRPRPHMVRGRGCNQSFRIAIDKSYDGPSEAENDDDISEVSSGRDTPASSSSRQGLDTEDGKKKKKKRGRRKEKKTKGKKKTEESAEDPEKKTKKKGFGLLRFGKKKEDKSKAEATKGAKNKLEALSEEELDRITDARIRSEPQYAEIQDGHLTPDSVHVPASSFPNVEDDDSDPNYARINTFRPSPSPQTYPSQTPSPGAPSVGLPPPGAGSHSRQPSAEDLEGLYATVKKQRPPAAAPQNQHQALPDSDQRVHALRREFLQARAAPAYDDLDAARRRALDNDPQRIAPRGPDARPAPRYEELDRQFVPRRDPRYDYPTHSRPGTREPAPYPSNNYPIRDPPVPGHSGRLPVPQPSSQAQAIDPRYYPSSPRTGRPQQQHRAVLRQDVPPSPTVAHSGHHPYETAGGRGGVHRQASPGRYTSPERYPVGTERYASPERYRYRDGRQPDPRQKNPMIGAV